MTPTTDQTKKSLKIFFCTNDHSIGHMNACVGLGQLLKERGHQISFVIQSENSAKHLHRFGFDVIFVKTDARCVIHDDQQKKHGDHEHDENRQYHPVDASILHQLKELFAHVSPLEKLKTMDNSFMGRTFESMKSLNKKLVEINEQENNRPDVWVVDQILAPPCIAYGKIPWVFSYSHNPIDMFQSFDVPPSWSGLPANDRSQWNEYREAFCKLYNEPFHHYQNKLNNDSGFEPLKYDSLLMFVKSPYLNVYCYPEELDYIDLATLPPNTFRLDPFIRVEDTKSQNQSFWAELNQFLNQKQDSYQKLVFFSLGSMGSSDVELMKRILGALKQSRHLFIVSMGPSYDQYDLPGSNMFGRAFLPQTEILPMVDLVITHGGNNTVTESFWFAKPLVVMPLWADQFDNAQRVQEKGFGKRIDPYQFQDKDLIETIDELLEDRAIRERCIVASERLRSSEAKQELFKLIENLVK